MKNKELEEKDKELEEFKKILPYLFMEEEGSLLRFLPLISVVLDFIILLVLLFKK